MRHDYSSPAETPSVAREPILVAHVTSQPSKHQDDSRDRTAQIHIGNHNMPAAEASGEHGGHEHGGMAHDMSNPAMAASREADIRALLGRAGHSARKSPRF